MYRSVFIILTSLFLLCGVTGCGCQSAQAEEILPSAQADTVSSNLSQQASQIRSTTLYYRDSSGYVVPVQRDIAWEEGIAKKTLQLLVSGGEDDTKLAARGIYAPLPADAKLDLDIQSGSATVNISTSQNCADQQEERAMVACVVNTLMEFPTVDEVSVLYNGQAVQTLPNGTDVSSPFTDPQVNVEPIGAPGGTQGKLQLCFGNSTGTVIVPVMRVADPSITPVQAVEQLLEPEANSGLVSLLPTSTQVRSVQISEDGTATIDLSGDFKSLSDLPNLERLAIKALETTLKQFSNIEEVVITIEGEVYEPASATMAGMQDHLNVW